VRLLLPDWEAARELDGLPAGIERLHASGSGPLPTGLADVEFAVLEPPPGGDPARLLAAMERVRVVQSVSAGVDWLLGDLRPEITLCDAAGVHDVPVAEWVVGAILAMAKRLPELVDSQRAAVWHKRDGDDLEGTEVLIVGHGSIGRALHARLAPFGVQVTGIARRPREGLATLDELPVLLPGADVVVVLLPLTDATLGLVDGAFLQRMRPGALLVNAARGPIVDTVALLDALRAGHVRAAVDVTDPEPLPDDHPLWSAPNVLVTPHVAGDVPGFPRRAMAFARDQVRRYVAGEPLENVVEEGY
jgi:phosphoglycerate dehydrogenase-like enzyme